MKGKRRESFVGNKFSESLKTGSPSEGKKEDRQAGEWPLWVDRSERVRAGAQEWAQEQ